MRLTLLPKPFRCDRGIALPTALIALMLLTALMIAFAVLSRSEPTIASNQVKAAQARTMAEAGAESAIYALTSTVIPNPLSGAAPSPYNGSCTTASITCTGTYVSLGSIGGFFVTVANGTASNERVVDAWGWAPTYATTGAGISHRHVHLTVSQIHWLNPPAAFSVRGELSIQGSSSISASADTSCGNKGGTYSTGTTSTTGNAYSVYGADGNSTKNQTATGPPSDINTNIPTSTFDQSIFSDSDLNMLKQMAQQYGTYLKGSQSFNSSNPFPNSPIIFVDTASGNNLNCTTTLPVTCTNPSSDLITVTIGGAGSNPPFNGWLIVNGSIAWTGNYSVNGMVYAQNDISISGAPTVTGAIMSRNIIDQSSTTIDSSLTGNTTITYNCADSKAPSGLPQGFSVKAGTYREVSP